MHELQKRLLELVSKRDLGSLTYREIGELIGEKFPQKVKHHLEQLNKRGLIQYDKKGGIIKPMSANEFQEDSLATIPIYGAANCGPAAIVADQTVEGYLRISPKLLKQKADRIFAIRAVGPSMNRADINGASIEDGDYVLIDHSNKEPKSGQAVLSIIDGMGTIKHFNKTDDRIELTAKSTVQYDPILIHPEDITDHLVSGVVVQVVKKPKGSR